MQYYDLHPSLAQWMRDLNERLIALLAGESPTLRDAGMTVIGARGKRLRPVLLLLCCAGVGDVTERALLHASLIELIHTASLAHDDVVDEADLRRGLPSAPARWGNKFSILLGDYLLARVFEQAIEDGELRILHLLAHTSVQMGRAVVQECAGLDLDAAEQSYWEIIQGKTSSLFSAAAEIGSIVGGATPAQQQALGRLGWLFGNAFQLADDLLNLQGTVEETGKPPDIDWRQRRATLPLLYAIRTAPPSVAQHIRALWQQDPLETEQLTALRACVESAGGFEYGWRTVKQYREEAGTCLQCLPDNPGRRALTQLCTDAFPLPVMSTN